MNQVAIDTAVSARRRYRVWLALGRVCLVVLVGGVTFILMAAALYWFLCHLP